MKHAKDISTRCNYYIILMPQLIISWQNKYVFSTMVIKTQFWLDTKAESQILVDYSKELELLDNFFIYKSYIRYNSPLAGIIWMGFRAKVIRSETDLT